MKPFYNARIGDLSLKDRIIVTCLHCGYARPVKRWQLLRVLPAHEFIQGIDRHMKCTRCKTNGMAEVRIELTYHSN